MEVKLSRKSRLKEVLLLSIVLPWTGIIQAQHSTAIPLSPQNLFTAHGQDGAEQLLDEQGIAGNPAENQNASPQTIFEPGYKDMYLPAQVIIDLKSDHALEDLWYYDMHGKDSIRVYAGGPRHWRPLSAIRTDDFRSWKKAELDDTARFLKLEFGSNQAQIAEMVFYGHDLGRGGSSAAAATSREPRPMGQLIGLNGFIDDPLTILSSAGGSLREYHRWQWTDNKVDSNYRGYPSEDLAFNPAWVPYWNFDAYYRKLKERGVTVSPVLQTTAPYLQQGRNPETKPIWPGANPRAPSSYKAHAAMLYQYAARYGSQKVPDSLLALRDDQEVKSGLGYLQYLENWNEPDKWWHGNESMFTPFEFAAMSSADYDGHEGNLGAQVGIKNADSSMKVVMGGITSLNLDYVKAMKLWSDFNRSSGFPADVLNFHHYSHNGNDSPYSKPTQGISPEADSLKKRLQTLVDYRNKWLPGLEIWLSEFGYDTNPASIQAAPSIGPYDHQEVQGQWLVRSYLEIAASGIDRAFMYMSRDVNHEGSRKYSSSGLTREKWNNHSPKKSFYYVAGLRRILGNFQFAEEIPTGDSRVNLYKFNHLNGDSIAYAVWCNTSEALELSQFQIPVAGKSPARLYQLQNDQIAPRDLALPLSNDSAHIDIGERPVFIKTLR